MSPHPSMKPVPIRLRIGLITILFWILSLIGWIYGFDPLYQGAFIRTAIVMTALWMAWPELAALPRWLYLAIPITLIAGAFRPQILLFLIPALLLYGFLRPKPKKGEAGRRKRSGPKKS